LPLVSLLDNRQLDTSSIGKGDRGGFFLADNEDVGHSGREMQSTDILNVRDVVGSGVLFNLSNVSDSSSVSTLRDHNSAANFVLVKLLNFGVVQVQLDGVSDLDIRVRESDRSPVVGADVRDSTASNLRLHDLAELELRVGLGDGREDESSLDIVQQSEILVRSRNGNNVHESSGVLGVQAALAVNLDEFIHQNHFDFSSSQCIFQSISEDDYQGKALSKFMGSSGGTRGPNSAQLVKHPVLGGC